MKNIEDIIMTRDWLMGPTFFTILNEMWTDFLRPCTGCTVTHCEEGLWSHRSAQTASSELCILQYLSVTRLFYARFCIFAHAWRDYIRRDYIKLKKRNTIQ